MSGVLKLISVPIASLLLHLFFQSIAGETDELGGGGDVDLLEAALKDLIAMKVQKFDVLEKVNISPNVSPEELKAYKQLLPVAMGLCLRR